MNAARLARIAAALGLTAAQAGWPLATTPNPASAAVRDRGVTACVTFGSPPASRELVIGEVYDEPGTGISLKATPATTKTTSSGTGGGKASFSDLSLTRGNGPATRLSLNNIGMLMDVSDGPVLSFTLRFAEYGGSVSLMINDVLSITDNLSDLDGASLGGAHISVQTAGEEVGVIEVTGVLSNVMVGGQELVIDNWCTSVTGVPDPQEPPAEPYQKMDLGDAPDSANHAGLPFTNTAYSFPAQVIGRFPTTFDPATAPPAQGHGPIHARIDKFWLGWAVTAEREADLLPDSDSVTNILGRTASVITPTDVANMDKGDDGWLNRDAVFENCKSTDIVVRISRSTLPLGQQDVAHLNVWYDGDRRGTWKDTTQCQGSAGVSELGYEWIIQNHAIVLSSIPAGGSQVFTIPTKLVMNTAPTPTHWLRFTLADREVNAGNGNIDTGSGLGDGRGPANGYKLGETEDYLIETPQQPPQEDGKPDLGDAPDSTNHWAINNTAYTVPPTFGNFPTVWQGAAPSGPKHRNLTMSGWLGNAITPEFEADLGPDADVVNNIMSGGVDSANRDVADDGWLNPFVPFPHCGITTLRVRVSRAATFAPPPGTQHFLNVWFDGNRDGDWQDITDCPQSPVAPPGIGGEWIVANFAINMTAIPAGGFVDLNVPTRKILNTAPLQNHWVRFSLTEVPLTAANGTVVSTLVPAAPARADGRGLAHPQAWRQGETEDYFYKPHLIGQEPGTLKIDKGIVPHLFGANLAGKVITYFVELDNAGGTIASTTTMTDPLPPQVVPVGLPIVTNPIPSAGPLVATLAGSTINWTGWLNPNSKVRIEQAVRVLPCWGNVPRTVRNTAYALQTATGGGGVISDTVLFEENCKPVIWDQLDIKLQTEQRAVLPGDVLSVTLSAKNNSGDDVYLRAWCCTLNGLPPGEPTWPTRTLALARGDEIFATDAVTNDPYNRCCRGHVTILKISAGDTAILSGSMPVPAGLQPPRNGRNPLSNDDLNLDGVLSITAGVQVIPPPEPGGGFTPEGLPEGCRERGDCTCPQGFSGDSCRTISTEVKFVNTDLGDAPDSSNHFAAAMTAYPGTPATYPTVFDPATGAPSGPRHHQPQHFHLGPRVSVERDADLLPDADGAPNLRPPADIKDRDRWDDGVALNLLAFEDCKVTKIPVRVFIDPIAKFWMTSTQKMGYINVWLDGNRDGDWADVGQCPNTAGAVTAAPEHIVINHAVNPAALALGLNNISVPTGLVKWPAGDAAKPAWLRVTLTTKPITLPLGGGTHSDGRGEQYRLGETEDYLYRKDTQPTGAGNVWVSKEGANRGVGGPFRDDGTNGDRITDWTITVGNDGSAPAQINLRDTPPDGWSIARVRIIGPDMEPDLDPIEFARKGWDGTIKGNHVIRAMVTMTKYDPPPHFPTVILAKVVITNTAVVTSPTDTDPSDNTATATVDVANLLPPVIVEPGDGTTCSGTITATGRAAPGSSVTLWVDGAMAATGTADGSGKWMLLATGLLNGAHVLSATYSIGSVTSPPSAPRSVTVDSSLSYDPLSVTFTDPTGSSHHPTGATGRTDDGGWLLNLKPHTTYTISVRICCAQDPNADIEVRFGPTVTVDLDDPDADGIFTGVFTTGDRMSTSMVISVLCAGIIRNSDGLVLIDPYGEVRDADTGALLTGATVTAYEFDGSAYSPWNAAAFSQINPQVTLADGWYSFFTPPGTYQIGVTKPGYQPHRSLDIVVSNQLVRYDVVLAPVPSGPIGGYVAFTLNGPDPAVLKVKPGSVVVFANTTPKIKAHYDLKANKKLLARGDADASSQGALLAGESIMIQYDDKGVYTYDDGFNIGTIVVENPAKTVFLPAVAR